MEDNSNKEMMTSSTAQPIANQNAYKKYATRIDIY